MGPPSLHSGGRALSPELRQVKAGNIRRRRISRETSWAKTFSKSENKVCPAMGKAFAYRKVPLKKDNPCSGIATVEITGERKFKLSVPWGNVSHQFFGTFGPHSLIRVVKRELLSILHDMGGRPMWVWGIAKLLRVPHLSKIQLAFMVGLSDLHSVT